MTESTPSSTGPLAGKTIALGVSGSIAAYKAADLTSELRKAGADIHVVMTESATQVHFCTHFGYAVPKSRAYFLLG